MERFYKRTIKKIKLPTAKTKESLQKTLLGYDLTKPVPKELVFSSIFWIFGISFAIALWLKKIASDGKKADIANLK